MNIYSKTLASRAAGVALVLWLTTGCAGLKTQKEALNEIPKPVPAEGYKPSSQYSPVNLERNDKVDKWIDYFTGRGRKYMHLYLERSARYIPMMQATFRERGMPDELAYIAMIESGFSPTAFSSASAVGYWQFIRETGKRYNLRIDSYVDERRDPILSTQSAANYLDSLYSIFGDWHLSLAAYNAGEGRILRAVMKRQTRNFWELTSKRKTLAAETVNYIPKFIAAVLIAKEPAKYGFTDIDFQPEIAFDSIVIDKPISLEMLATQINVSYDDLKRLNPRYKSDFVPVYSDRVNAVRVPVGMKEKTIAALPLVVSDKPLRYVASFEWYRVKKGDTLSHIARRFKTSIAKIRDLNDLSRRSLLRVGQRLKVPDGAPASKTSEYKEKPKSSSVKSNSSKVVTHHRVKKGETLSGIAAKYGLSISQLRELNGFKSGYILKSGTNLKVKNTGRTVAQTKIREKVSKSSQRVHVVKKGENLSLIAKKYKVSIAEIAKENSLPKKSKLFVGAQLVIPD